MFQEACEALNSENTPVLGSMNKLLSRRYTVNEVAFGRMNNRLQACVNLLHLLGTEADLNEQARLLVTQLQSEIALLRSILRHSIEPMRASSTIGGTP
ncbi:MAG TPA: hypothetical protein VFM10_01340 [Terriglobales bacterium]|nr:hypothetical protein [Terriglobales bacterium]